MKYTKQLFGTLLIISFSLNMLIVSYNFPTTTIETNQNGDLESLENMDFSDIIENPKAESIYDQNDAGFYSPDEDIGEVGSTSR